jgi:hypothetical protein
MKVNDLLETMSKPEDAAGLLAYLDAVLAADDLTDDDRGALCLGFNIGLTYALARYNEDGVGGIGDAGRTLLLRLMNEWEAYGVFG